MIKKTIQRRSEKTSIEKHSLDQRRQQATKTVVKTYQQDAQGAVYKKYYEYKKQHKTNNTQEENDGRTI